MKGAGHAQGLLVFYYAMRAADVNENTAKIMYGAVYLFGPRWGPGTAPGQRNAALEVRPEQQAAIVEELKAFVEKENPEAKRMGPEPDRPLAQQR